MAVEYKTKLEKRKGGGFATKSAQESRHSSIGRQANWRRHTAPGWMLLKAQALQLHLVHSVNRILQLVDFVLDLDA